MVLRSGLGKAPYQSVRKRSTEKVLAADTLTRLDARKWPTANIAFSDLRFGGAPRLVPFAGSVPI